MYLKIEWKEFGWLYIANGKSTSRKVQWKVLEEINFMQQHLPVQNEYSVGGGSGLISGPNNSSGSEQRSLLVA